MNGVGFIALALALAHASCFTFVSFDLDDGDGGATATGTGGAGSPTAGGGEGTGASEPVGAGGNGGAPPCGGTTDCAGGACEDGVCQGALFNEAGGVVIELAAGGSHLGWFTAAAATQGVCVGLQETAEFSCSTGAVDNKGSLAVDAEGIAYYAPQTNQLNPVLRCVPPSPCQVMLAFAGVTTHVNGLLIANAPRDEGPPSLLAIDVSLGVVLRAGLNPEVAAVEELRAWDGNAPITDDARDLAVGGDSFAISIYGEVFPACVMVTPLDEAFDQPQAQNVVCTFPMTPLASQDRVFGVVITPDDLVYARIKSTTNMRTERNGVPVFQDVPGAIAAEAIAADDSHVYFFGARFRELDRLWRCPHAATSVTDCASLTVPSSTVGPIVLTDQYVFYALGEKIFRAVKSP